jgi:chromosome segregation ATPase
MMKTSGKDFKTYSKKEVMALINTAGEHLIIKAEKIALETKTSKLVSDIDYKREFIAFVSARTLQEEGRLLDNKTLLGDVKNQLLSLRQEAEDTHAEVLKQHDMRNKAQATMKLRQRHAAQTENVRVLGDNVRQLKFRYDIENIKFERVKSELQQKESTLSDLKNETADLKERKGKCLATMPEVSGPEDLQEKQTAARNASAEFSSRILKAREGLNEATPRLPGLKTRIEELFKEKDALSVEEKQLVLDIAELSALESKDKILADVEALRKDRDDVNESVKKTAQTIETLRTASDKTDAAILKERDFAASFEKTTSQLSAKRTELEALKSGNTMLMVENSANGKFVELLDPVAKFIGETNAAIDAFNQEYRQIYSQLATIIEGELK